MTINSAVAKLPACVWFGNSCGCAVLGKMRGNYHSRDNTSVAEIIVTDTNF